MTLPLEDVGAFLKSTDNVFHFENADLYRSLW